MKNCTAQKQMVTDIMEVEKWPIVQIVGIQGTVHFLSMWCHGMWWFLHDALTLASLVYVQSLGQMDSLQWSTLSKTWRANCRLCTMEWTAQVSARWDFKTKSNYSQLREIIAHNSFVRCFSIPVCPLTVSLWCCVSWLAHTSHCFTGIFAPLHRLLMGHRPFVLEQLMKVSTQLI